MDKHEKPDKQPEEEIDPELKRIQEKQIQDMKNARLKQRSSGGPPMPGPPKGKLMTDQQALAQTVMANAQGLQQFNKRMQQFAQQTEQSIMVTQRAVQNLARPDLILTPVVDTWHNGPHPHMVLLVKEGMRIVAVGEIISMQDVDPIEIRSEQGIISIKNEYVLMIYKKEEGVLYGQARRDSEAAAGSSEEGSEKPEDSAVEAKKI